MRSAISAAVVAALPVSVVSGSGEFRDYSPYMNAAYPPGDVRRYGAVGNGIVDCAASFHAAIDDSIIRHTALRIPRGVYLCGGKA